MTTDLSLYYEHPTYRQQERMLQNAFKQQYTNARGCTPPQESEEPKNNRLLLLLDEEV